MTYKLTNSGSITMDWKIVNQNNATWISLSRSSGSLLPMKTENVEVGVNTMANSLPVGNYITPISFINLTNGNGNTARNIELLVLPKSNVGSATLLVSPNDGSSTTFTGSVGGPFNLLVQTYPT